MQNPPVEIKAVVVGLVMLILSAVPATSAERPGYEIYVVRSGDTLSKISGRIFGDEMRWREILRENPQVTNANRIFPGDTLLVPMPATSASAGGAGESLAARAGADSGVSDAGAAAVRTETAAVSVAASDQGAGGAAIDAAAASGAAAAAEAVIAGVPVEPARPVAVVSPSLYRSAGYIADNLPSIAIVASQDDRTLLGSDDAAIVNAPIPAGARFTVVRADRRIFHPLTGAYLGWLVRILGTAEVTCRGERTSTVALRGLSDAASIGDYLLPIDPDDVLVYNVLAGRVQPECIPAGVGHAVIVAFNEDRQAVGEYDLAYIDRGTSTGVTPGQHFTIYREVAPEGRVTVGELQILRSGVHTSTALITTSIQEVQVGHLLRAR